MFSPFYNRIIRKMVVAFGSLFNEITLIRYNNELTQEYERIKVPLIYSPKEKFISRLFSDPDLTRSVNTVLPRMGFEVTGYTYDSSRKSITTLKSFATSTSKTSVKTQNVGVPYDMDFTLSIYARNIEDGTQIVEQILPYFTPDFTITINFIDGFPETTKDVPFILNSVDNTIEYEGDFTTTRLIIWNLNFTAKTYFFGPVSEGKIIMGQAHANGDPILDGTGVAMGGVKIGLYNELFKRQLQELTMKSTGGSGNFKQNETVRVANNNVFGKVYSWSADTYTLTTKDWNGVVVANDVITGDETNASWTVDNIGSTYIKIATIKTVQDPLTAGANDDFGFTTTITEFPNA
jgi:hypothetical protein